jgi:L-2-hydroxyglutarate oxidase LhgO
MSYGLGPKPRSRSKISNWRKINRARSKRKAVYAFCQSHGIAFNKCGKLIVSTSAAEDVQLIEIARAATFKMVSMI